MRTMQELSGEELVELVGIEADIGTYQTLLADAVRRGEPDPESRAKLIAALEAQQRIMAEPTSDEHAPLKQHPRTAPPQALYLIGCAIAGAITAVILHWFGFYWGWPS